MENNTAIGWNTVEEIETVTIEIAEVIKQADLQEFQGESHNTVDLIANLYERRQLLLDNLRKWYNSANGQRELRGNPLEWGERIDNLIQADSILLENIKRRMDDAQYRLRNIQQTKSLMIYSRG
ncbi:MAG: hypothetical protein HYZ54_08815 [Ignavibacteriae bacterium]|nr:hypothetical protein [Ignavibacteriota bacterium]